jgi:hypothetical protein
MELFLENSVVIKVQNLSSENHWKNGKILKKLKKIKTTDERINIK